MIRIIIRLKQLLVKLFPKYIKTNEKYSFNGLQVIGENHHLKTPKEIIRKTSLAIGNNVQIDENCFIDARGGVFIGDNVKIGKNVSLITTSLNKNNDLEYKPIIIGNGIEIGDNKRIHYGSIIKNHFENLTSLLNHDVEIIFIISTGRSGSKAIANLINYGSNSECLHDAFSHYNVWACDKLYNRKSHNEIKKEIEILYRAGIIAKNKVHAQSDQKLSVFIPELANLFPKAKFIWLIRRADSFVNSAYSRGWYFNREFGYPENKKEFFTPNIEPPSVYAAHRINGFKTGNFTEKVWKDQTAFERNCWYWSFWNGIIEKDLSKLEKNRWIKVKLDNLNNETESIAKFIGMKNFVIDENKINSANYNTISFNDWSEEMIEIYNKNCKLNMEKWFKDE